jgi:hypothetical protein
VYDYNDSDVVSSILQGVGSGGIPFVFDCIGSKQGSIAPISQIAVRGTRVAILLPVIVKDSTEEQDPEYEMDVEKAADWAQGVDVRGVRTHFYLNVSIQKQQMSQSTIADKIRTSSSNTAFSPTSCTRCSRTVSSHRRNRGSWRARQCCSGRRKQWTCCDKSRPVWRDWSGASATGNEWSHSRFGGYHLLVGASICWRWSKVRLQPPTGRVICPTDKRIVRVSVRISIPGRERDLGLTKSLSLVYVHFVPGCGEEKTQLQKKL